jgi:hypothetical protein
MPRDTMNLIPEPQQEAVRQLLRKMDAKLAILVVDNAVLPLNVEDVCGGEYLDNRDAISDLEGEVETLKARIESIENILAQVIAQKGA